MTTKFLLIGILIVGLLIWLTQMDYVKRKDGIEINPPFATATAVPAARAEVPRSGTGNTQPAPAPSTGQKTAGRTDLEWAGTIVTPLTENGKLAGAQVRARFPIKPNSAEWIDRLDFNGTNGVSEIPQGEVGTVWIKPSYRAAN